MWLNHTHIRTYFQVLVYGPELFYNIGHPNVFVDVIASHARLNTEAQVGTKPGLWTGPWTRLWTALWTSVLDLIVFQFCHLKRAMNGELPNEQGIGITVGTDICAAFSKTDWLV